MLRRQGFGTGAGGREGKGSSDCERAQAIHRILQAVLAARLYEPSDAKPITRRSIRNGRDPHALTVCETAMGVDDVHADPPPDTQGASSKGEYDEGPSPGDGE